MSFNSQTAAPGSPLAAGPAPTGTQLEHLLASVPRPLVALAADYPAEAAIRPHRHSRTQLVYASAGIMRVSAGSGTWVVPPQRAVWVPAGVIHAIAMAGAVQMRTLYLHPDAARDLPGDCRVVTVPALLRELILRAVTLPRCYDEGGAEGRIMALILDEIRSLPVAPLSLPLGRDRRLAKVTNALQRDPGDRRGLEDWARTAGASPRTLARLFHRETAMSFRTWRQQARLLQALVWLAEERSVTTTALDLGYDSPSAFIVAFKKAFGVTPARYFR